MLKKVEAYIRLEKLTEVRSALVEIGVPAIDAVEVQGHGRQTGIRLAGRHSSYTVDTLPRLRLTVVVNEDDVAQIVETIRETAATGTQGDGAIYICPVENLVRISTGKKAKRCWSMKETSTSRELFRLPLISAIYLRSTLKGSTE